jgi:Protein of unknown function (DUF2975)
MTAILPPTLTGVCYLARLIALAWLVWALVRISLIWWDGAQVTQIYARLAAKPLEPMSVGQHLASYCVILLAWAAAAVVVLRFWQLFGHYLGGRIFDAQAVTALTQLGWAAIAAVSIDLAARPVMFAIVSGGAGFRFWSDPNDLLHAAIALFIVIMAHIFEAGVRIDEDNRQIV